MPGNNSEEKYDLNISFFFFLLGFLVMISAFLIYSGFTNMQQSYTLPGAISIGLGVLGLALVGYNLLKLQGRLSTMGAAPAGPQVVTKQKCKSCGHEASRPFKEGDFIYGNGDACPKCGSGESMLIRSIFLHKPAKKRGL